MNTRLTNLIFGLFLAVLLVSFARPAQACSCMAQTVEEAARSACAVFEGLVLAVEPIDGSENIAPQHLRVTFRVTETWTPGLAEEVSVTTAANSAACGVNFEVGRSYVVYADGGTAEMPSVSLCGGTKLREQATEDLRHLGMGVVPVSPSQPTATSSTRVARGGCAGCSIGSLSSNATSATTLMIMTLALLLVRGFRRSR